MGVQKVGDGLMGIQCDGSASQKVKSKNIGEGWRLQVVMKCFHRKKMERK
jgi:hypothetical protein